MEKLSDEIEAVKKSKEITWRNQNYRKTATKQRRDMKTAKNTTKKHMDKPKLRKNCERNTWQHQHSFLLFFPSFWAFEFYYHSYSNIR